MRSSILFVVMLIASFSCNNLEDASPSSRKTFVRFFEGPYNMSASSIEIVPDGYVILGNSTVELTDTTYVETMLLQVDENGNRIGDIHTFSGGTGKAFKYIDNGTFEGYVIVGDSIYTDLTAEQAANVTISSMRILHVSTDFDVNRKIYIADRKPISEANPIKTDFFGNSVNFTDDGLVFLGSFKEGVINQQAAPEKHLLFAVDSNLDSAWYETYELLGNTFANSKSVHYTNGTIIWATAVAEVQGDFTTSYVAVPFVEEASGYLNSSSIGLGSSQSFLAKDIQRTRNPLLGYGVIGTYSQTTDGSKGNMFFMRVSPNGDIVPGSDRYFDAIESFKTDSLDVHKNVSSIIDEGEAITSTLDGGFVLAGSFTTSPLKGNGGKDILLIKVSSTGTMIWAKTYGGSGDETVSAIRETSDGDILICGTNNLGDYSSIFLMKLDKNGELKN